MPVVKPRLCFQASAAQDAQEALLRLRRAYGDVPLNEADIVVALGGDGFMLDTLHSVISLDKPVYGMNRGSVGFLMNDFDEEALLGRLASAREAEIHPLRMTTYKVGAEPLRALAINEVSLLRETRQAAKLRITVDGSVRLNELICDGILLATPAGSTAYNLSAHGPILPIDANLMALTPISAFRPRRWRGALLPSRAWVRIDVLESEKRPVSAVADTLEVRDISRVDIEMSCDFRLRVLFDKGHSLDERILREQFLT